MYDQTKEEQLACRVIRRHIKASEAFFKEFHETRKEIISYCRDGHSKRFYQEYLPEASMYAQVSKTAEALDIFGAGIYSQHPNVTTTPRRWASEISRKRAETTADYINAVIRETNEDKHNRKAANDGLLSGRGVWRIGTDRRGLVCGKRVPIQNFLMDPDWEIEEQITWVGQKRYGKRFELINKYPHERKRLKEAKTLKGLPSDVDLETAERSEHGHVEQDGTHDLLEYYELYYRVGLANFTGAINDGSDGTDNAMTKRARSFSNEPQKYIYVVDGGSPDSGFLVRHLERDENGQPLMVQEVPEDPEDEPVLKPQYRLSHDWEIPFWRNGSWPLIWFDLLDEPDGRHAASPLKAGLGPQRVLNYLFTLAISKARTSLRDVVLFMEKNGVQLDADEMDKILNGGDYETVSVKSNSVDESGISARELVHVFQFPEMKQTVLALINLFSELHEKSTGLYDILHSGQTARQMRSAAEVEMRDRNSRNRLSEMGTRFEDALSRKAQAEAFAVRYLNEEPDMAKVVGEEGADGWGTLVSPELAQQLKAQFTAELKPQVDMMARQYLAQGAPPQEVQKNAARVLKDLVSQRVEEIGVQFDAWIYEHDFQIEAGSARKKNQEWEIEVSDRMLQTIGPAVVDRHPEIFLELMIDHAKSVGKRDLEQSLRERLQMMQSQPPMPQPAQAPPPQEQP